MDKSCKVDIYIRSVPDISRIDMSDADTFPEYRRKRISSGGSGRVRAANYTAGIMLRDILGVRDDEDISFSEKGKPYLTSGGPFFSLSHDDLHVVLSVGDVETGIDTETPREIRDSVKRRVFTEEERAYCKDDIKKGVRLWTRLESALKLSGEGIGGIDRRTFSLLKDHDGLFIETFEEDGSVISVACGEPFGISRIDLE